MNTKKIFFWSAVVSAILLLIVLILLNVFPPVMSYSDGISFYGVIVTIVAGVFTVWGLYWAASEFSDAQIMPDLELIIGAAYNGRIDPLQIETKMLQGEDNIHKGYVRPAVSRVILGLFLENNNPKAAQFVRVTLRIKEAEKPLRFEAIEESFRYYKPKINTVQSEAVFLQFGEDCVVYKGDGVFLGTILVEWEKDKRPEKLNLKAGLYNLVGEPKTVMVSRPIDWG